MKKGFAFFFLSTICLLAWAVPNNNQHENACEEFNKLNQLILNQQIAKKRSPNSFKTTYP